MALSKSDAQCVATRNCERHTLYFEWVGWVQVSLPQLNRCVQPLVKWNLFISIAKLKLKAPLLALFFCARGWSDEMVISSNCTRTRKLRQEPTDGASTLTKWYLVPVPLQLDKLEGARKRKRESETSAMAEWFAQNPKNLYSRTERMHRGLELKSRKANSARFEF